MTGTGALVIVIKPKAKINFRMGGISFYNQGALTKVEYFFEYLSPCIIIRPDTK
jgi:hypothetical protein